MRLLIRYSDRVLFITIHTHTHDAHIPETEEIRLNFPPPSLGPNVNQTTNAVQTRVRAILKASPPPKRVFDKHRRIVYRPLTRYVRIREIIEIRFWPTSITLLGKHSKHAFLCVAPGLIARFVNRQVIIFGTIDSIQSFFLFFFSINLFER